jgi:hypothetical protein
MICLSVVFSSCALVTLNEKRQSENIVATVSYTDGNGDVQKRHITRLRLQQTYYQVVNQYYSSYGSLPADFDPAKEVESVLDQLCDYQLVVLYAIDYLSQARAGLIYADGENKGKWNGTTGYTFLKDIIPDRESYAAAEGVEASLLKINYYKAEGAVLTYAEFDKVIKNANAQYESLFDTKLKEAEAAQKARDDALADDEEEEEEEEEEKTLTARKVKTAAAEEAFDYKANQKVKDEGLTKYYPADYENFTGIAEAVKNNDTTDAKNRRDAWSATQSDLNKAFIDYNYLLNQALESMVIFEYKRELTSYKPVTDEEVAAELEKIVKNNKDSYKTESDYKTAMDASYSNVYYHKNAGGYFYVKNIVVQFDAVTKAKVDAQIKLNYKDSSEAEKDPKFIEMLTKWAANIGVNVSNIFYDPDDGTELFYTFEKFGFTDEEKTQIEGFKAQINKEGEEWTNKEFMEAVEANKGNDRIIFILSAALDTSKAYLVEGLKSTTFFEIYEANMKAVEGTKAELGDAEYAKSVIEAFDTWFYAVNDDSETKFNSAQDYLVYNGLADDGYSKVFVDQALSLYNEKKWVEDNGNATEGKGGIGNGVGNYYYTDELGNDVYYSVSQFGYHILMVTYVPFDSDGDEFGKFVVTDGEEVWEKIESDAVAPADKTEGILSLDHVLDYLNLRTDDDGKPMNDVRTAIKATLQANSDNHEYFVNQREILNLKNTSRVKFEKFEKTYKDLKKAN